MLSTFPHLCCTPYILNHFTIKLFKVSVLFVVGRFIRTCDNASHLNFFSKGQPTSYAGHVCFSQLQIISKDCS